MATRKTKKPLNIAVGLETKSAPVESALSRGSSSFDVSITMPMGEAETVQAARVLVEHLFARGDREVPGIAYAVAYHLTAGHMGGDIVDVYHFDNDSVAFSIADISGKGAQAAVHAALIKYGLRAYSSHGLSPEKVLRAMDRLYLENNTFEQTESFASVFFALLDPERRAMTYACAGHEPVFIVSPGGEARVLAPTAPLIGVFDDQHHLFRQKLIDIRPGCTFVATTDGITEARNAQGELYGIDRLRDSIERSYELPPSKMMHAILSEAHDFANQQWRDDVAILVARFL